MKNSHKTLTIYKASAGSGKTFTLSVEYIKLLIANPYSFRSTLAVTFTNKATEEMKTRILSQLYGIWKQLPSSRGYMDRIKHDLDVSDQYMSERAGIALHNIVMNYSYFRIETIDSFFQSVLRNLARELDLAANLRVELNDYQIERFAIDEIIDNLTESDEVLGWIMDYVHENIDEEKNWNVIGQIKKFGENIFREFYKTNSSELNARLSEKSFFPKFVKLMRSMREDAEAAIKNETDAFFDSMDSAGITIDDLKYGKSGVASFFLKLRSGFYNEDILTNRVKEALNAPDDIDKWVKKTASPAIRNAVSSCLMPLLQRTEDTRRTQWNIYQSCTLTLRHLNQLRLLSSIEKKVREINSESNRFLLSDTHTLLHSLIQDSDSPFIFEKIGSYIDNIMIDEFQDTSSVQWQNFKVLLKECMSDYSHTGNLIVGDVKQSIYRWRSGDWRMLNNIEREFPYMHSMLDICTLDSNYRSDRRVVEFNNTFFTIASNIEHRELLSATSADGDAKISTAMADQLQRAYSDVCQKVPSNKPEKGYVSIELLPSVNDKTSMLERTKEHLEDLLSSGVALSDIAILVRSNTDVRQIADYLGECMPDVKLVSADAFRLDSSVCVNIIVGAMHCLADPDDTLSKAYIAKAYMSRVKSLSLSDINTFLSTTASIDDVLPHRFASDRTELISMPLYELAEELYIIFGLEAVSGEDAYICEFFDLLSSFISNNTSDINMFLQEWDDNLCSNTITTGATNGIQLITIHKSKGLEFKHVIVPFCDWKLEKGGTIWCSPQIEPFNKLPLVPVDYSAKGMRGTIYTADYANEHLQNVVDNLNLLYVAFTRASSSLFVIGYRGKSSMRSYLIEQTIADINLEGSSLSGDVSNPDDEIVFTYGDIDISENEKSDNHDNIFFPHVDSIDMQLHSTRNNVEFLESNRSQEFVVDDEDTDLKRSLSYIQTGRLLHQLFSGIHTIADVDKSIADLEAEGVLDNSELTPQHLKSLLHKRFANKQVADWFSDKWTLFNECTILTYDATLGKVTESRPDRVMKHENNIIIVDFKFGADKPAYADQVRRYMSLIRGMGYDNVKGYLWFVYTNKIKEIK